MADSKIRILFLITSSEVGGAEKDLSALLRKLDRSRFDPCGVVVLKRRAPMAEEWEAGGVGVVALGMKKIPSPFLLWRLHKIISKFKPDIVHAHLFAAVQAGRALRLFDSSFKLVSTAHVNTSFYPWPILVLDRWARTLDD